MSARMACQRVTLRPSRSARTAASGGGGRHCFQRSAQYRALLVNSRPGARACSERAEGALPSNATAQASTACPELSSSSRTRPCPAGGTGPDTER